MTFEVHGAKYGTSVLPCLAEGFVLRLNQGEEMARRFLLMEAFARPELPELTTLDLELNFYGIHRTEDNTLVAGVSHLSPCWIHQLVVAPAHQRQGLGRYLIQAVATLGNCPYILAQLDDTTTSPAWGFYRHIGFCEIGGEADK